MAHLDQVVQTVQAEEMELDKEEVALVIQAVVQVKIVTLMKKMDMEMAAAAAVAVLVVHMVVQVVQVVQVQGAVGLTLLIGQVVMI